MDEVAAGSARRGRRKWRSSSQQGVPVAVNGVQMDPVAIVELLNEIGARNAIGRIDLVENRFVGMKSRGCYETPGGTLLLTAHRELEALCLDRDLMHFKQHIGLKYAEVVYFGLWFTPLRESLQAFVASSQADVNGTVTLRSTRATSTSQAQVRVVAVSPDVASFTMGASYNQKDAEGFIRILGLPARSRALVKSKVPKFGVEQRRDGRRRRLQV